MALSYNTYAGDGATTNFAVTPSYIVQADIEVYEDGVLQVLTTDYTWFNLTTISFNVAPAGAAVVKLQRRTQNTARLVDFQDAGNLTEVDLDLSAEQTFFLMQEAQDDFTDSALSLDTDDKWDAESKVIKLVADGVADTDAVNKAQALAITAADVVLTNADVVSTNADVVTTNADVVITNADAATTTQDAIDTAADAAATAADLVQTNLDQIQTTSDAVDTAADLVQTNLDQIQTTSDAVDTAADAVSTAADVVTTTQDAIDTAADVVTTNADVVITSQDAIDTAADAVLTAADVVSCAASYDSFDDRYLGAKASEPTLDNDADALLTGALFFDTTANIMKVYGGASWTAFDSLGSASTTKGNILVADGSDYAALTVGADYEILQALASETTGTQWTAAAGLSHGHYESSTAAGTIGEWASIPEHWTEMILIMRQASTNSSNWKPYFYFGTSGGYAATGGGDGEVHEIDNSADYIQNSGSRIYMASGANVATARLSGICHMYCMDPSEANGDRTFTYSLMTSDDYATATDAWMGTGWMTADNSGIDRVKLICSAGTVDDGSMAIYWK